MGKVLLTLAGWGLIFLLVISFREVKIEEEMKEAVDSPTARVFLDKRERNKLETYEREVKKYVIDSCYGEIARTGGLIQYVSEEDAVEMIRLHTEKEARETTRSLVKAVIEQPKTERMKIYKKGLEVCIRSIRNR